MSFKFNKLFFFIFSSVLISYLYILNGDFLGDDIDRIAFNPELRSFWTALTGQLCDRPLLILIVTAISKLTANSVLWFRLFSITVHTLVSIQIYQFILELTEKNKNNLKNIIALICAFIFALHPLNNQAISMSIQMGVLLSGLFGLISIRYFFRGISRVSDPNFKKSVFFFLLGILSKPNLTFLPLFFLLNKDKIQNKNDNRIKILSAFFTLLLIPVLFYFYGMRNVQTNTISPFTYFMTQWEVLFTYFKLMILPYGLKFLYDFETPVKVWESLNWFYLLAHISIISIAILRLPSRLLIVLFLGFYISFLPESSFFPINHLAFEHRTYFPLIFLFLFIGCYLIHINFKNQFQNLLIIIGVGIGISYLILNQNRNMDIKRYGTWALHTLNHSVNYDYHNFMFSFLLMRAGNLDEVEPLVRKYQDLFKDKDYDILADMYNYYKFPEKKIEYFEKFIVHLDRSNLNNYTRLFINKILIEEFAHQNENINQMIKIEKTLSQQLELFSSQPQSFPGQMNNYYTLSNFLLSPSRIDSYKRSDYLSYLKTKANLKIYFNQNFENLEKDIENELQKNPYQDELKISLDRIKKMNIELNTK